MIQNKKRKITYTARLQSTTDRSKRSGSNVRSVTISNTFALPRQILLKNKLNVY